MNTIDQNNAMLSLEQALVPKSNLIDGRSEKDQLRMLVDFASLFNFYDQDNTINGNWSPFLLKDPVFLVASIAKTSFQKVYSLFINTCVQLQLTLKKTIKDTFISNTFNQLFEQLTNVFQTIQDWTNYMKNSSYEYNLKTYVINNVKETYSLLLWSLLEFQQALTEETIIPHLQPVDTFAFENYDQKIWKDSKGKMPYWTVLGLPIYPCEDDAKQECFYISKLTPNDVFTALQYTGKKIFSFYSHCISYADIELESIKEVPGHFPDTILLRTFTSLLKIYQTQFNSLATEHLNFYYRDILLQTPENTVADTVFASCQLTKTTETYRLQNGTTFAAGVDANKQPILFEATEATSLNPAKIANAYTLTKGTGTQLYLQQLAPVNVVNKNESGVVQSWNIFGSQTKPLGTQKSMAIAFGSPMFYLAEANTRTITLNFTFSSTTTIDIAKSSVTIYLSTEKAWFQVPQDNVTFGSENNPATTTITLKNTDPAITAFTKNPDGYTSDWPLCKMVFSEYSAIENQIIIQKLDIDVAIDGFKNFQLFNDFGAIDPTKPFQPLGVSPNVNQNFMIGSNEIFSKPFNKITFTNTWNPFPVGFKLSTYYNEYNDYLTNKYATIPANPQQIAEIAKEIINGITSLFKGVLTAQKAFFENLIAKKNATIKGLIATEIATLKKLIEVKVSDLKDLIHEDSSIIKDIISVGGTLLEDLEKNIQELFEKFENGAVDSEKITDTKNTALAKIDEAKNTLITKVEGEKTTVASKKTSLFGKIGNAFENLLKKEDVPAFIPKTFQYSNASFSVNFSWLQNGLWQSFEHKEKDENGTEYTVPSSNPENLFFTFGSADTSIPASRMFSFSGLDTDTEQIDPTLQNKPLQLTDTTDTGFLKMQLIKPNDGFGLDLYPKVVGAIALYNGNLIANKSQKPLVNPPNIPFTPIISAITGTYAASASCDFTIAENNTYPLECFYYTPFQNYKVYDTINGITIGDTTIGNPLVKDSKGVIAIVDGLPLVPSFSSNGQLFLELENVVAPAEISFYFELATTYSEKPLTENAVEFTYLSKTGWKTLPIIADGTNGFTCSGIITVNVPGDITTAYESMPSTNSWVAIGTQNSTDGYAKATFLKTNGITLKRIINTSDVSETAPQIQADIISSPVDAIPEISATVQPFPSFGGKASETTQQMNSRVSTRLKTKDRLVTAEDYFNVIRLKFAEVYYSKTDYDQSLKKVITYLVKRVSDATVVNAFEPLVSECTELDIQNYIEDRINAFTSIAVSNFTLQYIKITASIIIDTNYEITTVTKEINDGINVFLSPWITSAQAQITIDKGISTAEIASFINSFEAVIEIESISFQIGSKDFTTGTISYDNDPESKQEFTPKNGALIVPSLNNLTKESSITYSYHI